MESDEEGFEYPIIDKEQCINCGLCNKVCPQTTLSDSKQPINIYAIKHPDQEIQLQSSSGGAFSLIAEWVIQKGGIVFGAIFDDNWNVIHGYTESISGLEKLRMSKYVQSKGKEAMGWDELTNTRIPDGAIIYGWRGYGQAAVKAAEQGHRFVMTPARIMYLIRYQGPQWFEPLTYFGNNTLKDVYRYEPIQKNGVRRYVPC